MKRAPSGALFYDRYECKFAYLGVQSKAMWVRDVDHAHTDVVAEVQISQCVGHGLDTL
jgi:hypothetical protein